MSYSTEKERREWIKKSDKEFYEMFIRYLRIIKEDEEENKLNKYLQDKIERENK